MLRVVNGSPPGEVMAVLVRLANRIGLRQ
jgi:hypothetical protein